MIPIDHRVPMPKHGSWLGKKDGTMIHSFPRNAAPIYMIGEKINDGDETVIGVQIKSDAVLWIVRFDVDDDVEI